MDGDTWHFDRNCSKWPEDDYIEREFLPSSNEICNECQAHLFNNPELVQLKTSKITRSS